MMSPNVLIPKPHEFVREADGGLLSYRMAFTPVRVHAQPDGGCVLDVIEDGHLIRLRLSREDARHLSEQLLAQSPTAHPAGVSS